MLADSGCQADSSLPQDRIDLSRPGFDLSTPTITPLADSYFIGKNIE
ncbi:hypothetical protein TRIP_E190242 [uncultured Spirochaetota bacterium]|uniref:Uncharacterized protein n=1 Tax=uncultured Spirochaetota bacterium TaxID=460511 RepID=A0A652ZU72_9SPIR|nr:hypothetical protein TRIP_E190242 [uncultured Spirochaetota bacterium]